MRQADVLADGTAFQVEGPASAPVVVFIHGLGLNSRIWDPFVSELAGDYLTVCYDLPGHGKSRPSGPDASLETCAGQLHRLMDFLEIGKACIVGFSLGGMINRRFALDRPERTAALAIFNSPHERDPHLQKKVETQAMQAQAGGPAATLDDALKRWLREDYITDNPGTVEAIRNCVLACDPDSYAKARKVLAFGVRELIRPDPPVTVPALVMTCENDTGSTPAMSQAISGEIPGSALEIVPGLKHLGLVEAPIKFLDPLAKFLAIHWRSRP